MKKVARCLFLVVLFVQLACVIFVERADAETVYSIHAEWMVYTPPSSHTVSGFRLYQEGIEVISVSGNNLTSLDAVVLLPDRVVNFTLTAIFTDGTESPHSSPFAFNAMSSNKIAPFKEFERVSSVSGAVHLQQVSV